jgi:hypothetical protein
MTLIAPLVLAASFAAAPDVPNGGFEDGLSGWRELWARDKKTATASLDRDTFHTGSQSVRIAHTGNLDWSFQPDWLPEIEAGDICELNVWVKVQGRGSTTLGAAIYDARGKAISWTYGARTVNATAGWKQLTSRFAIPANVVRIQPRLIGNGPATVWLDDFSFKRTGNIREMQPDDLPKRLTLDSSLLSISLNTGDGTLDVLDKRNDHRWRQKTLANDVVLLNAQSGNQIEMTLLHTPSGLDVKVQVSLVPNAPEFVLELAANGPLPAAVNFPHPFVTKAGTHLIVPMNEGISYPVEDESIHPKRLIAYGGHGICMGFWGVTDGERGQLTILETPDDASFQMSRMDGLLCGSVQWDAQKQQFGDTRRIRYAFFEKGGHVAMCKRYRRYAQKIGLFKSFEEKRRQNLHVDQLIGAVNVWCWDRDPVGIVKDLQAAGIDRILWSRRGTHETISQMNDLGVLTSRYDIYQDVMNPDNFRFLRGIHGDWTTPAWPNDRMLRSDGDWIRGWRVKGKNGEWYPCGVLCDRQAPQYARERIAEDMKTHPYRSRFIDTTTAAPWRECYDPNHPATRSESRRYKMELLGVVSEEFNLITGCETGHEAAVPFVHYFEGMMSLGPYRVPDAGRQMGTIWDEVPERVAKFQVGHKYRLPLWELVYHDCVVAQWYWGDYNNKLPAIWDKRDLFNTLYATPPMFMFKRQFFNANKDRFVQSYKAICPVVRAVGYAEMTDHKFLTPNRNVQLTAFSNGVTVTANFGDKPYLSDGGTRIAPMSSVVDGLSTN